MAEGTLVETKSYYLNASGEKILHGPERDASNGVNNLPDPGHTQFIKQFTPIKWAE